MKIYIRNIVLLLAALALMFPAGLALAANLNEEIGPCPGENVQGTVVSIDENGVVTIDTGDGQCTVTLGSDVDQPIAAILGLYFGDVRVDDLSEALDGVSGCASNDGSGWVWAACSSETEQVQVLSYDPLTGLYTATVLSTSETITFSIDDAAEAEGVQQALDKLTIDWALDGSGDVVQTSEEIAALHAEGIGFGVLTKLYALAAATGVPVADLLAEFQAGAGIGELFATYGKPAITGVGHVQQEIKKPNNTANNNANTENKKPKDEKSNNRCKPKPNGKGGNPKCP